MRIASVISACVALLGIFISDARALNTPLLSGGAVVPSTTVNNFSYFNSNPHAWNATEANSRAVAPVAGTLRSLYVDADNAPGAATSYAFTVFKNGAGTGITCTISNTATRCTDLVNTVSLVAGDTFSIQSVPAGTPAAFTNLRISAIFATPGSDSLLLGCTRGSNLSTVATENSLIGGCQAPNGTLNIRDSPVPVAGAIDKLYVDLSAAPGVGSGYTITVLKNGIATAITCNIIDANTTCNDTTHSASVIAGDLLALQYSIQSGTPGTVFSRHGVRWLPTTPNQTIMLHNPAQAMNVAGAARYSTLGGGGQGMSSAEVDARVIMPGSFFQRLFTVQLNTAPGASAGYTLSSRINLGFGANAVTINDPATTGTDSTHIDTLKATDIIDVHTVSIGAPASSVPKWGIVLEPKSTSGGQLPAAGIGN